MLQNAVGLKTVGDFTVNKNAAFRRKIATGTSDVLLRLPLVKKKKRRSLNG